jgi:mono/diheme cytochrome c family protein
MKRSILEATIVGVAVALASGSAVAQAKIDLGKREYDSNCATCHGADGKGGGAYVEMLKKAPPDLTTLAKRNKGVLPVSRLYEVIDGREEVKAHGPRDMPVWGADYRAKARAYYYLEAPADPQLLVNPEVFVRARVLALIDYLGRLQAK